MLMTWQHALAILKTLSGFLQSPHIDLLEAVQEAETVQHILTQERGDEKVFEAHMKTLQILGETLVLNPAFLGWLADNSIGTTCQDT